MTLRFLSDPHFGHENIIKYCLRPFDSADRMDEYIVDMWNQDVRDGDHVYILGDIAMKATHLRTVKRLKGRKRLIRGNHDIFRTKLYLEAGFEEIHGCRVLDNMIFTHLPIHPQSLGRFLGNVHGHLHNNSSLAGPYLNICVEHTDYRTITLEEVKVRLKQQIQLEAL